MYFKDYFRAPLGLGFPRGWSIFHVVTRLQGWANVGQGARVAYIAVAKMNGFR